jgi:hypothetical protein
MWGAVIVMRKQPWSRTRRPENEESASLASDAFCRWLSVAGSNLGPCSPPCFPVFGNSARLSSRGRSGRYVCGSRGGSRIADLRATKDFTSTYRLDELPSTALLAAGALSVYLVGSLLVVRQSPFSWIERRYGWHIQRYAERLEEERMPSKFRHKIVWRAWRAVRGWRRMGWAHNLLHRASSRGQRWEAVDSWLRNEFDVMSAKGRVPVMRSFNGGCHAPTGFDAFCETASVHEYPSEPMSPHPISRLADLFVSEIKGEKSAIEVRIQMRFPEVYAEIDRLKVEAELRMSIFWPLMLIVALLAWVWSPWALVALPLPPLMLREAFKRRSEASEKTWSALIAREVTSPILDSMAEAQNGELRDFAREYGYPRAVEDSDEAS